VPGEKLVGWPGAVDAMAALDAARGVARLGKGAELASIQAELTRGGRVDFSESVKNPDWIFLSFLFVDGNNESEVRIDAFGIHGPRIQPRTKCGEGPCRVPVPIPKCAFAQIWEAARQAGALDSDRPFVTYGDGRSFGSKAAPEWLITIAGRGRVRVDANSCAPLPRERLRPPQIPLAKIPGAPSDIDPMEVLTLARTQAGLDHDAVLLEIDARGVSATGRVDLATRGRGITYTFADPVSEKNRRWREVRIDTEGMPITPIDHDTNPLPPRFSGPPPAPPKCNFVSLARGFQTVLVGSKARVVYGGDATSGAGKWTLEIPEMAFRQNVTDAQCESADKK
jgi:hypothetical protein